MARRDSLISLLPGEPDWQPQDGAALRAFLASAIGQLFLRRLVYERPTVSERKIPDVRRIQSDERAGFEACIAAIQLLAEPTILTDDDRGAQSTR